MHTLHVLIYVLLLSKYQVLFFFFPPIGYRNLALAESHGAWICLETPTSCLPNS